MVSTSLRTERTIVWREEDEFNSHMRCIARVPPKVTLSAGERRPNVKSYNNAVLES